MIFLSPEIKSDSGEDIFLTWFEREFSNTTFDDPDRAQENDIILRYSTKGVISPNIRDKSVALFWELLPEMKVKLNS